MSDTGNYMKTLFQVGESSGVIGNQEGGNFVWSPQRRVPWVALIVVPFEEGSGLLPRCSGGYGGRGTVLPLCTSWLPR